MHYCVLVVLEKAGKTMEEIGRQVDEVMAPYHGKEYDWYQIGGRWTGKFDGYDADRDPKNKKKCTYCNGTGKRKDMEVANGCNACGGTGKETLWPTEWKARKGDVLAVKKLTEATWQAHAMCIEGYGWMGGDEYLPWKETLADKFKPREKPPLDWLQKTYPKGVAVVVDCHN